MILTVRALVTVRFDPEAFEKTNILLHEADNQTTIRSEQPRVSIEYSGFPIDQYQTRIHTSSEDGSTPMASLRPEGRYMYPLSWWNVREAGSRNMAYGAVILFKDLLHDCLVIVWGLKFPQVSSYSLAFVEPDGWRSQEAAPFCKTCTIDPEAPETAALLEHGFSENPRDQLDEMEKLLARVNPGETAIVSTTDSRISQDSSWGPVRIKAEIKPEEFLGRTRFLISLSMKTIRVDN